MLPVCSMRACSTMESTLWLVTNVAVADLQALNWKLLEDCRADENRIVSGQTECMGIQLMTEKEHPLTLATALRSG